LLRGEDTLASPRAPLETDSMRIGPGTTLVTDAALATYGFARPGDRMSEMTAAAPPTRRWIFGPVPDLFLGCGLGYAVLALGVGSLPLSAETLLLWGGFLTALTGMPHYGATLLRVYEHREDRRRYALFAVWATLAVWAVFVWGVYDAYVGSLLLTVYLSWSPWHYTGQNYGLAVMFLRRGGFDLTPPVKRTLYVSFFLSFLLALLSLHGETNSSGSGPAIIGSTYGFVAVEIPRVFHAHLFLVVLALYGASLLQVAYRLRRVEPESLLPVAALVVTQGLWFSLPAAALWWSGRTLGSQYVLFYFVWIAIGHSVQYLWITTYYAAGSAPRRERLRFLLKTMLAGAGIWTVPALVFSPALLGEPTYLAGLYMLVASAVNVHHFILDGAIWKLRDGPVARILLGSRERATTSTPPPLGVHTHGLWRRALWAVGIISALIAIAGPMLHGLVWAPAVERKDWARAAQTERLLTWVGRSEPAFLNRQAVERIERQDLAGAEELYQESLALYPSPEAWAGLGGLRLARGDEYGAMRSFEQGLRVHPTAELWVGVGALHSLQGRPDEALEAFESALRLDRTHLIALRLAAQAWLERGDREKALERLTYAASIAPEDESIRAELERASR
jgi:hypothetical protein